MFYGVDSCVPFSLKDEDYKRNVARETHNLFETTWNSDDMIDAHSVVAWEIIHQELSNPSQKRSSHRDDIYSYAVLSGERINHFCALVHVSILDKIQGPWAMSLSPLWTFIMACCHHFTFMLIIHKLNGGQKAALVDTDNWILWRKPDAPKCPKPFQWLNMDPFLPAWHKHCKHWVCACFLW